MKYCHNELNDLYLRRNNKKMICIMTCKYETIFDTLIQGKLCVLRRVINLSETWRENKFVNIKVR